MTDLTSRDQRMMLSVLTIVHLADTKAELDADTDALLKVAADHMCQMAVLRYQQLDGLNTALPIGTRKIDTFRTLTTESLQSYDIHDLGEELKQPGFVTITDAMINRINYNWAHGKKTHIFVDEFHIAYENEYSGNFFTSAWRQFRKRNAAPCAITQNVEYMLDSVQASTMVSNSEFVVMLNQAESDQERLSKLLNISPEQMSYVNGSEAGCGLMRYGSALVPFVNRFPVNTELYKLITTKPGEGLFAKGQVDFHA
mgnify:FL=1